MLRKSKSDEFGGGGWGVYTPNRRGMIIIIRKGDIVTSYIGFEAVRAPGEGAVTLT